MAMRVAVIGLGDIAQKAYLPILAAWEGLELLFYSRTGRTVERMQAQHRVARGATRLDALLEWQPQAAFVLTPSATHAEIGSRLLAAGVDVFLEKPAAASSVEAHRLVELAEAQGRILMVGFNRRYAPIHRLARDLWGDRPVGMISLEKHRASGLHPDLRTHYMEELIHTIDLLRFFCGEAEPLDTVQQVQDGRLAGAASTVALEGGGYGVLLASMQSGQWREQYDLHGAGASLHVEAFSRVVFTTAGEQRVWDETYASSWKTTLKGRGFFDQIAHFFECVQSRAEPRTSGWEAVKTQQLLEALLDRVREAG